jgi:hypothetical protein
LRELYRELIRLRRTEPALLDFSHRQAKLLEWGHAQVLKLVRGDQTAQEHCEVYFNLSYCELSYCELSFSEVAATRIHADRHQVLLSSEERRFGGIDAGNARGDVLHPFSFLVTRTPPRPDHGA